MTFVKSENPQLACKVLRQHDWFTAVDDYALVDFASNCQMREFRVGQELFNQGDACKSCLLVTDGCLEGLRYTAKGGEKVFGRIQPGKFAAIQSLFVTPALHWHTIRAISDGDGLLIEGSAIKGLCQAAPVFALQLLAHGASLIQHHTDQIDWLTSSSAEQRLSNYILRSGQPVQGALVQLPLSWSNIATKLGIRAETVSRILAKWQRQGLIRNQRNGLYVLKPAALEQLAKDNIK